MTARPVLPEWFPAELAPDPEPWPPRVSETWARAVIYQRSNGLCELGCGRRADSFAHRRAQGQGGQWRPSNGLHLCGDGVAGCHGWTENRPTMARVGGWRLVREHADPTVVPVWLNPAGSGAGWYLIDDRGIYWWCPPPPDADRLVLPKWLAVRAA